MENIFSVGTSKETRLQALKQSVVMNNSRGLRSLESLHRTNFDSIWNSSEHTPQEVLDLFGTNAANLFVASKATQDFIKAFNPDYVPLVPPYEFTINEDGTVTVGDKIPVEEPVEPIV